MELFARRCVPLLLLFAGQIMAAERLAPFPNVVQVVSGGYHNCVRLENGGVWCWGLNTISQLGLGDDSPQTVRTTPVKVQGLVDARRLAAGNAHTCAITADRGVSCWGLNDVGQSGDASLRYSIGTPNRVEGLGAPVTALALGASHSCALLEGGEVKCWGDDTYGQLGDGGAAQSRAVAAPIQGLGGAALGIEAGSNHTCAAVADGSLKCWGRNGDGQLGDGTRENRVQPVAVTGLPAGSVRALAAGENSTCAITSNGALFCWGPQYPLLAFDGGSLSARPYPGFESGLVTVTAGSYHFCALGAGNAIRCFGENINGQFGTGPQDGSSGVDAAIGLLDDIVEVSAGAQHTCARSSEGGLQCWGDNVFGQIGLDTTSRRLVPTQVAGLESGTQAVAVGNYHACALSTTGVVRCWGANDAQQVGDGSTRLRRTPVDTIDLGPGVRALASGAFANCAITASRRVKCWGANYQGQLGIGGPPDTSTPLAVTGLGEIDALAIGGGREHACALLAGGTVKCWGDNSYGQLGDGTQTARPSAVEVSGLPSGIKAIGVGYLHTCAITANNGVKCWGINENGQLGDGTTTNRLTPVDVSGLSSGVLKIAPGGLHTCALVTGGGVKCWGASYFGLLLGDESQSDRAIPGDVPALRQGVADLTAGLFSTCARLENGAMRCWGTNDGGSVGDNSTISRPTPVPVAGLNRGVTSMGIGYGFGGHACAVVFGSAKCWGENTVGQLGDGSTHGVTTPQRVLSNAVSRRVALAGRGNNASRASRSDASGRYVVFESDASNLVPGDTNGSSDIFRTDRETGLTQRISVDDGEQQIVGDAIEPAVSGNGRYIVFVAPDAGVNKLRGESKRQGDARRKGGSNGVFLRNMVTGSTQRMGSATSSGVGTDPQIAPTGVAVAFTTDSPPAGGGPAGKENVYYVPLTPTGAELNPGPTSCVSCKTVNADGSLGPDADGDSSHAAISADGKQVAFETTSKNVLAASASPCPASSSEIMMRDLVTGSTQRMSPAATTPATSCGSAGSSAPSIDYAGNTLAFQSDTALASGDGNGATDVYVIETTAPQSPILISQSPTGADANGSSGAPSLSGDGMSVAFVSSAQNLDLSFADNNDRGDVHTAIVGSEGEVARLSRGPTGAESNAPSDRPALNFDGSRVSFDSAAQTLAVGAGGEVSVYQRDNPLAAPVRSTTWWKSTETGWGLTVFDQGNVLVPAWFTYDADGEPTWFLTAGAFPQADGSYRGDLLRLTGTPFDRIDGPAVLSATTIGNATLRFEGEESLAFAYDALGVQQTKQLTRFPFGSRTFACTASPQAARDGAENYSDIWSGAIANAGWGLTVFHVDDSLFAGWYTYDADGEAVFFVVATSLQADGSFVGPIFRQRNGVPFSQIDDAAASAGSDPIGDATFRFSDGDSGTFSYRVGAVNQSKPIARLVVGARPTVCASADGPVQ